MSFSDVVFFFKQKTAYEMRISDWSSDVCSSDLDGTVNGSDILIDSTTSPAEVAMDAAGDFVVAWTRSDAAGAAVHAQRYHAAGTPDGAQLLGPEPSSKPAVQGAMVAMHDQGTYIDSAWGRETER